MFSLFFLSLTISVFDEWGGTGILHQKKRGREPRQLVCEPKGGDGINSSPGLGESLIDRAIEGEDDVTAPVVVVLTGKTRTNVA